MESGPGKQFLWIIPKGGINPVDIGLGVGGGCFDSAMSIHRHDAPHASPAGVVAELVVQVRALGEVMWAAQPGDTLIDVVEGLQGLAAAAAVVEAGAVVEVEARDLAKKRLHFGSTGDWLTHTQPPHKPDYAREWIRYRPRRE
jgi:hypothetical protein